mmetsp:Transcript_3137/g.7052  ORF Transcript_3137/g.7052 Transcript_3137/m.7052 type:complete len:91 (+) Transcript_3137:554-826(+)
MPIVSSRISSSPTSSASPFRLDGDCLIFNPRIRHSISSRVLEEDTVYYTMSTYIKLSNVSGHDNTRDLSEEELKAETKYFDRFCKKSRKC